MRTAAWCAAAVVLCVGVGAARSGGAPEGAPSTDGAAAPAAPPAGAAGPGLRFGAAAGEELRYVWSSEQVFRLKGPGDAASERRASVSIVFRVAPESVDLAGSSTVVAMESYAFVNDAGDKRAVFDSRKPSDDPAMQSLAAQLKPLLGAAVKVRADASGRVTAVEGVDSLPQTPVRAKFVSEIFSVGGMQRKLGPVLGTRAGDAKAEAGAAWSSEDQFEVAPGAMAEVRTEHSIEKVEGGLAFIGVRSRGTMPPPPETSRGKPVFDEIVTTGTQVWDLGRGALERFESTQVSAMRMGEGASLVSQAVELKTSLVREADGAAQTKDNP